ncbi:uncharacterized protein KZ484_010511 [Pholidichthys leucotaenia]
MDLVVGVAKGAVMEIMGIMIITGTTDTMGIMITMDTMGITGTMDTMGIMITMDTMGITDTMGIMITMAMGTSTAIDMPTVTRSLMGPPAAPAAVTQIRGGFLLETTHNQEILQQ